MAKNFVIRPASSQDVKIILSFIKQLADYEKLSHAVVATEEILLESLFGDKPYAEAILGYLAEQPVAFALFFHNFSTFLGRPGIYLEDLFVIPEARGQGYGKKMLSYVANIAKQRKCERLDWWVINWNEDAIQFYKSLGAQAMSKWTVYRLTGDALNKLSDLTITDLGTQRIS